MKTGTGAARPRVMPRGGGTPREEVRRRSVSIEKLLLRGLAYDAIAEQLGLHKRVVQRYIGQIRRDWSTRQEAAELRRELIAKAMDIDAQAAIAIAGLPSESTVRVGYLNSRLRAQERVARLIGADAAVRSEVSGPSGGPIVLAEERPLSLDELGARLAAAREGDAEAR